MDSAKKYWFYLYPHIYTACVDEKKMLLYDTKQGLSLETQNIFCIQFIKRIYSPENMGVIDYSPHNCSESVSLFVCQIVQKKMGCLTGVKKNIEKPIVFPPILNLQCDVDKLIKQGEDFIGDRIIRYLSELNLFLNGECKESCQFCEKYYKQVKCCHNTQSNEYLSPSKVEKILSQAAQSGLKRVNLLGGDLSLYVYWEELCRVILLYNFEFHIWMNYRHLLNIDALFVAKDMNIDIIVNFPINEKALLMQIQKYGNRANVHFYFLVENEEDIDKAETFLPHIVLGTLLPIYTGENFTFFKENVFVNKTDIFSEIISMRKIFCNQKLNANDFGVLNILPDGTAKANLNTGSLGNTEEHTLLEIIYKELIANEAWRKIRNASPCKTCLFQFLCPPPSNYEKVIGRNNLCSMHQKRHQ